MNCNECQQLIADAVGGEISPTDSASLNKHLAGCATCRAEFDNARSVLRTMQSLSAPPNIAVFRSGQQLIIQPTGTSNARNLRWANTLLRYVACILVAFVAGYFVAARQTPNASHTIIVEKPVKPVPNHREKGTSLESAIVSVHKRHPNESPLTKCLLAMAGPGNRKIP